MTGQIPARCRSATSFGPVCDQYSVTEFGLYCFNVQNVDVSSVAESMLVVGGDVGQQLSQG